MATFYDVLVAELARQAAELYGNCSEDVKVGEGTPYAHPPVIHFSKTFSILPGWLHSSST